MSNSIPMSHVDSKLKRENKFTAKVIFDRVHCTKYIKALTALRLVLQDQLSLHRFIKKNESLWGSSDYTTIRVLKGYALSI